MGRIGRIKGFDDASSRLSKGSAVALRLHDSRFTPHISRLLSLFTVVCVAVIGLCFAAPAFSQTPKLIVKDSTGNNTVFSVDDTGKITGTDGQIDGNTPPQWTVQNSSGNARMDFMRATSSGVSQLLFGTLPSTIDYQIGELASPNLRIRSYTSLTGITLTPQGYVGIGTASPTHLLQLSGGAYSDGYDWYSGCSRSYKKDITDLGTDEAMNTLNGLKPVTYYYKTDKTNQEHVGFIAEDVPSLVSIKGRKAVSPLDIVAVLTKVVKEQQKTIAELSKKVDMMQREMSLKDSFASLNTK